jgi:prolyl oligopeptidase
MTHRHRSGDRSRITPSRVLMLVFAIVFTLSACTTMTTKDQNPTTVPEAAALATARAAAASAPLVYPPAPRGDVVDDYHGTRVADPYRWLEDPEAQVTKEFVRAQNALAQPWLEALPQRGWIRERLTELWNYERVGLPRLRGGKYFFLRNDGTQNQSVLHVADSLQAAPRVLFDPNAASSDATVALARFEPSPDGSIVAYSLSDGGTDWEIWKFRRTADGVDLPDELRFTKFWELSWAPDGSGVYYSRYPQRVGDPSRGDDQAQPAVYFHRLGEPQGRDTLVYAVKDHPTRTPSASVSDDGRWLFVSLFDGYRTNGIDLIDLRDPEAAPRPLFAAWDARYTVIGSEGDTIYAVTTEAAPRSRVIAVDVRDPAPRSWRELVAQDALALDEASFVGGRIIARYVRDAHGVARLFDRDGRPLGEVPVPGFGTLAGFGGKATDTETFFAYADYLSPGQVLRLDLRDGSTSVWRAPRFGADTSRYVTRQVFYTSRDGTRVPMYITHRRDLVKNGDAPTLLYGYGGFNVSLTPSFRPAVITWLEMGGIYAEANLRGGGEYGDLWHEAGTKLRKQNVFDDFIAAAEFLVRDGYTRAQRLAISGRSNGGLLVGATLLQRPDLFAAALPGVGVLDMLRYHTASANARQWSSDYGLAENPEEFAALRAYSPVHNVRPGTCYPPTLVTTADRDDRVVPWHSYKFAAALQHAQACASPVLLRVETRAGHGAGKPTWMQIEDFADQWAFAAAMLGIRLP